MHVDRGLVSLQIPESDLFALGLEFVHDTSISGTGQHTTEINDLLDVDVFVLWRGEDLGLGPEGYDVLAVVMLLD